jgi:hypothetical protein
MSRFIIGSRAALIAALRAQVAARGGAGAGAGAALAEEARALTEELFLDALFLVAQLPGGQIAEAGKCCYAYDVRLCAGLCTAAWAEEAFWSGLVRVRAGPAKRTRLMCAAARGDTARVRWLLARGAPREAKDVNGWTALYWASSKDRSDVVDALLAAGANVDAADDSGRTPLYVAARDSRIGVMRALLAAGACVEAAGGFYGWRPLHALLTADGYFDAYYRPLIRESYYNARVATATLLLDAGADVNALWGSRSPLNLATSPAMRALLVSRGGM